MISKNKQKIISNRAKNRYLIILGLLVCFLAIKPILTTAQVPSLDIVPDVVDIKYKPNVPIPIKSADGKYDFATENTLDSGGDFLAAYIVAIYTYGAGFAGIVAMFMLVIAGWRWLLAGGNASKISASKEMVTSVLIGLALLFGGQLLLRQISEGFSSVQSLDIKPPLGVLQSISDYNDYTQAQLDILCADKESCSDYNRQQCELDPCNFKGDPSNFSEACIYGDDLFIFTGDSCGSCFTQDLIEGELDRCAQYEDAWHRKQDICDWDGDGLGGDTVDPDGCCIFGDSNGDGVCDAPKDAQDLLQH